jgi:hypothetical protein
VTDVGVVIVPDELGRRWIATADACVLLRVSPCHIQRWVYRSQREQGFPRVDRPVRAAGAWWYQLDQLIEAERRTALASSGRRRPGALTS